MASNGKTKLTDLKPLKKNPNKGSERGQYMLEQSLEQAGVGRSIVVAANGDILAGNHVYEAYGQKFENEPIIVETEGDTLVVVKRTDLPDADDPRAKALILGDNRAGDFIEYDSTVITDLLADSDLDLAKWFREDELAAILAKQALLTSFPEYDETIAQSVVFCTCPSCGHKFPK